MSAKSKSRKSIKDKEVVELSKEERASTAKKKKSAGKKGKTVVANTSKAKVKLKNGGEVRRIARGCGKVMSDRRKRTKFS